MAELDKIDRSILRELQRNGRLTNVELAGKVGLSESACLRRVKILEDSGLIEGYAMLVSQAAAGKPESVFVHVTLDSQQQEALQAFEKGVHGVPGVMECYLMSGEEDYLLRVIVRDASDYERVHREQLTRLPGVARIKSFFALRTVVKKTEIPL
ncbi:MAG TPA: Lrp/AsnC family transcriptional regulator [Sphingomonadales bacterium]|nr:Lrp/AsnC family transcriptional regulator [Sphingomonadales bacterium]